MGAIKAVQPYAKEVLWSTPLNIVAGACKSLTGLSTGLDPALSAVLPDAGKAVYHGFTGNAEGKGAFGSWLGETICDLGKRFFHGGVKACVEARGIIGKCLEKNGTGLTMDAVSDVIRTLGLKGGAFGALFVLGAGALSYMGWNVFRGEHKVLKDLSNGYPGDVDERKWIHWGKFLSGTSMLAGGLAAIFAPAVAPAAFVVAASAFAMDKAFDFFRWLQVGGHWFNVPLKAPLGLSSYMRQNNYDLRY